MNPKNDKKNITIRMTAEMHQKLKELADLDHRTLSSYVETIILKHLESLR